MDSGAAPLAVLPSRVVSVGPRGSPKKGSRPPESTALPGSMVGTSWDLAFAVVTTEEA
jgi:hypothetical protein